MRVYNVQVPFVFVFCSMYRLMAVAFTHRFTFQRSVSVSHSGMNPELKTTAVGRKPLLLLVLQHKETDSQPRLRPEHGVVK